MNNLNIDIFKGKLNTFITLRHIPTGISIAQNTQRNVDVVLEEMKKELKLKIKGVLNGTFRIRTKSI